MFYIAAMLHLNETNKDKINVANTDANARKKKIQNTVSLKQTERATLLHHGGILSCYDENMKYFSLFSGAQTGLGGPRVH